MANQWLRLWHDMPTDPKWRTIAKVSKQRIGDVIAVFTHLLVCASNATERGRTQSFNCEDVASALDLETEQVEAIVEAMQARVLDGDKLKGWEIRQVAREDGSAERAKAWREAKQAQKQTQANETERNRTPDTDTDTDTEQKQTKAKPALATRLPAEWTPSETDVEFCKTARPELNPSHVADEFRDYWTAAPGARGRKADWAATWRNWVRNQRAKANAPPGRYESEKDRGRREVFEVLCGGKQDDQTDNERDITGIAERVG